MMYTVLNATNEFHIQGFKSLNQRMDDIEERINTITLQTLASGHSNNTISTPQSNIFIIKFGSHVFTIFLNAIKDESVNYTKIAITKLPYFVPNFS